MKNNQKTLRAEVYRGYQDATNSDDQDIKMIGKKVILPATFVSGDRDMPLSKPLY